MTFHQPFDLFYWFVNVFAGGINMFLAFAFLGIAIMAGMFRMPTIILAISMGLFIIMISVMTGTLFLLVLLVIAIAVGWSIARLIKS